jgi:hypothetical protein
LPKEVKETKKKETPVETTTTETEV